MSVRKNGRLRIKYAKNEEARAYMRLENMEIESKKFEIDYEEEKKKAFEEVRFDWEKQRQIYMSDMWRYGADPY